MLKQKVQEVKKGKLTAAKNVLSFADKIRKSKRLNIFLFLLPEDCFMYDLDLLKGKVCIYVIDKNNEPLEGAEITLVCQEIKLDNTKMTNRRGKSCKKVKYYEDNLSSSFIYNVHKIGYRPSSSNTQLQNLLKNSITVKLYKE
jgi:hypothetical protein